MSIYQGLHIEQCLTELCVRCDCEEEERAFILLTRRALPAPDLVSVAPGWR